MLNSVFVDLTSADNKYCVQVWLLSGQGQSSLKICSYVLRLTVITVFCRPECPATDAVVRKHSVSKSVMLWQQFKHLLITMLILCWSGLNLHGMLSHVVLPMITAFLFPGLRGADVRDLKYDISLGRFQGMLPPLPMPLDRSWATTMWNPSQELARVSTILRSTRCRTQRCAKLLYQL